MEQVWVHRYWIGGAYMFGWLGLIASPPAFAQITPDNTLGNENSRVTRNVQVRGRNADRIDGGAARGANLFHSFSEFNVNEGQQVYFANPSGIENILSRVTGTDVSDIMGTLGVDGGANLFMLNPNGIIFGPNAQLDISGSFVSSTADSFAFPDGSLFSASSPGDSSLLSVNVPLGVQYGANPPGAIVNAGNLTVGRDLRLSGGSVASTGQLSAPFGSLLVEGVAGDVQVRQANAQAATLSASNNLILQDSQLQTVGDLNLLAGNTVWMRDSVTNPFLAYAGGNLTVQGNQYVDIFALSHPSSGLVSERDMVLRSANTVGGDAHYWTGGNFRIEQLDGNLGNLFSPYDPIIRSTGDVAFGDYTGASLHVFAGGSVTAGNITITGADLNNGFSDPGFSLSDPLGEPTQAIPLTINGETIPTLDVRAGITDFSDVGGATPESTPVGAIPGLVTSSPSNSSNITIGSITNRFSNGQILLTNQYRSSGSPGIIRITGIIPDQGGPVAPNDLGTQSISAYGSNVTIVSSGGVQITNGLITGSGRLPGGNITIYSGGSINTGSLQSQVSIGNGGDVTLRAVGDVTTGDIFSTSTQGFGGGINITNRSGIVRTGTIETTANTNRSDVRNRDIRITAGRGIETGNLSTRVTGTGFSGLVELISENGGVRTGTIETSTGNTGSNDFTNPGVTITADGDIVTGSIQSSVRNDSSGSGNAGDVTLTQKWCDRYNTRRDRFFCCYR
jgi:filamentous hemagglutinin family protein